MLQSFTLPEYPALAGFLAAHDAAVIAVPIDLDGTLHAAGILYFHTPDPLKFYFVTSRTTEKCRLIGRGDPVPCACVVGTERATPFTLQLRGDVREVDPAKRQTQVDGYYAKRGDRHDDIAKPNNCLLEFVPTWGRFTDYSKGYTQYLLQCS